MDLPRHQLFNASVKALQFEAWRYCQDHGTDMTTEQLAERLDVPAARLRRVLRDEQWSRALRVSRLDLSIRPQFEAGHAAQAAEFARTSGAAFGAGCEE